MALHDADPIDPRAAEAAILFDRLYGDATGWLSTFEKKGTDDGKIRWFDLALPGALEDAAEHAVTASERGVDVWYGVGLRSRRCDFGRGAVADVGVMPGMWADIDVGKPGAPANMRDARDLIQTFPLPPSVIVGSGGGLHCYWLFKEPYTIASDAERAEIVAVARGWQRALKRHAEAKGYALDSVADLARVMRIPGTDNWKTGEPRPVTIHENTAKGYTLGDFDHYIPDDVGDQPRDAGAVGDHALSPEAVGRIVAACKPAWRDGQRHPLVKALAGFLANNGVAEAAAAEVVRRGSITHGDQDPASKQHTVRDTYAKLRAGVRPLGWAALKQMLAVEELTELDRVIKPILIMRKPTKDADGSGPGTDGSAFNLTDLGNAERLVAAHGHDLRYCPALGWLVYEETMGLDGPISGRWIPDTEDRARRRAHKTIRSINDQLKTIDDQDERQKVFKFAMKSEQTARIEGMLREAKSLEAISIKVDALDQDAWLLNFPNGIMDLRTGRLQTPRREDLITRMVQAPYDADAPRAAWNRFLDSIFTKPGKDKPDAALLQYVQRMFGYAICGDPRERVLPILWGAGKNGKSVLIEAVCDALGPGYAGTIEPSLLYSKRDDSGVQQKVARLRGLRLVTAVEGGEDQKLDSALVKRLTGKDTLTARRLYHDEFTFQPTHVIALATNHRPKVTDSTASIWDRLRLVPFSARFFTEDDPEFGYVDKAHHADRQLAEKLQRERAGILAWLVEGARAYLTHGLKAPSQVLESTNEYRAGEDAVGQFIAACCLADPTGSERFSTLFAAYVTWHAELADGNPMSDRSFGRRLTEKGFPTETKGTGNDRFRARRGIRLRDGGGPDAESGTVTIDGTHRNAGSGNFPSASLSRDEILETPFQWVPDGSNGSNGSNDPEGDLF